MSCHTHKDADWKINCSVLFFVFQSCICTVTNHSLESWTTVLSNSLISTAPIYQQGCALHQSSCHLALHIVIIGLSVAMETHFTKLPTHSPSAVASRGSLDSIVSDATKNRWFLHSVLPWSSSTTLRLLSFWFLWDIILQNSLMYKHLTPSNITNVSLIIWEQHIQSFVIIWYLWGSCIWEIKGLVTLNNATLS